MSDEPKPLWDCVACIRAVELDAHGRCPYCGSNAIAPSGGMSLALKRIARASISVDVDAVSSPHRAKFFAGFTTLKDNHGSRGYGVFALPEDMELPEIGNTVKISYEWESN